MNILYIHRTQSRGVEAVHILGMVNAFKEMGHNLTIISPPGIEVVSDNDKGATVLKPNSRFAEILKWLGKTLPEIVFELSEILLNFVMYFKIVRLVQRAKIGMIYERYALNTFAGTLVAKKYNIPIAIEVNDASFIERVRKLSMKRIAVRIENWVFINANLIATISGYFKDLIVKNNISAKKILVLPNAVSDGMINKAWGVEHLKEKLEINSCVTIGYVGAFVYWHRVDLLLGAFREICAKNRNIKLLLVGDGVTYVPSADFVKKNNLEVNVIMPGRVKHDEVFKYISIMDICVIPDSNDYGSPMKLFEYMAMGKAVVVPKLGPLQDVIRDRENGILFKKSDRQELKNALMLLIDDKKYRESVGKKARESIFENHTWTKNAQKVLSFIYAENKK